MDTKVVLFDLDGTLLPMDQDVFVKSYFGKLAATLAPHGYDPKELVAAVWAGTMAMIQNSGDQSNERVFWANFTSRWGEKALEDLPLFDSFYQNEFDDVRQVCGYTPQSRKILNQIKEMGLRTALATNPIFPAAATQKRIRWAGLNPEDFELCTTYENSRYCKPNLKYYLDIVDKLGVRPEECLMVGNDVSDDMPARELGMKVFLLTDCLINTKNTDIGQFPHGNFHDLSAFLKNLRCK